MHAIQCMKRCCKDYSGTEWRKSFGASVAAIIPVPIAYGIEVAVAALCFMAMSLWAMRTVPAIE